MPALPKLSEAMDLIISLFTDMNEFVEPGGHTYMDLLSSSVDGPNCLGLRNVVCLCLEATYSFSFL